MTHLRSALVAAFSLMFLAGCTGPTGMLLGSLAGAGATLGGQSVLNRAQEDVEAKIIWRVERRKIVASVIAGLMDQATKHLSVGRVEEWKATMISLLEFHDTQRPETLIKELKRRRDANTAVDAGKS